MSDGCSVSPSASAWRTAAAAAPGCPIPRSGGAGERQKDAHKELGRKRAGEYWILPFRCRDACTSAVDVSRRLRWKPSLPTARPQGPSHQCLSIAPIMHVSNVGKPAGSQEHPRSILDTINSRHGDSEARPSPERAAVSSVRPLASEGDHLHGPLGFVHRVLAWPVHHELQQRAHRGELLVRVRVWAGLGLGWRRANGRGHSKRV